MLLKEAKEILKSLGYKVIKEDTDDWDEADMPIGKSDMARSHNERNKGAKDLYKVSNPKGYDYWELDMSGKELLWKEFLKNNNVNSLSDYKRNNILLLDIEEPDETGIRIIKVKYVEKEWWGRTFFFYVDFPINDKAKIVGPGLAKFEHFGKTYTTEVKDIVELAENARDILKQNLKGGWA